MENNYQAFPGFEADALPRDRQDFSPSTEELKNLDPDFAVWLKLTQASGKLSFCLSFLMDHGLIKEPKEGIEYIYQIARRHQNGDASLLSYRDFTRFPESSLKSLSKLSQQEIFLSNLRVIRWQGLLGHHLVARLENQDNERELVNQLSFFNSESAFRIFRKKGDSQYEFFTDGFNLGVLGSGLFGFVVKPAGDSLRKEALLLLDKLGENTKTPEIWLRNLQESEELAKELCLLLPPDFSPYTVRLRVGSDPFLRYLSSLTIQTWARAWLDCGETPPKVILPELKLLSLHDGLLGGRVDGLEVVAINGTAPDKAQRQLIRDLYLQAKEKTVRSILAHLFERFGQNVELKIIERKFCVGDGVYSPILSEKEVTSSPIVSHEQQLRTYLTLFAIGRHLADGLPVWRDPIEGKLAYYLPRAGVVAHKILAEKDAQEDFFKDNFVYRWHKGKLVSNLRAITNAVLGHLQKIGNVEKNARENNSRQLVFFPKDAPQKSTIELLVEFYREFLDPETKVFEIVGADREFTIDIARLSDALSKGLVRSNYFRLPQGGQIACPIHNDPGPSLFVYLELGHYHCFGCGRHGRLVGNTFAGQPIAFSGARITRKLKEIVIPQGHSELMEIVQRHLQEKFWGSAAERYLLKERRLNPKIAFDYGAGYDDGSLIPLLLKDGYKLEDIEKYGFHLLKNRVTFPLKILDKYSNFYGRHIFSKDKAMLHRKLRAPSLPTGSFNMDRLLEKPEAVIIVEGVMDALTIIEGFGLKNIIAIIGSDNVGSIDTIAGLVEKIGIAMDNDVTGREKTVKIQERLRRHGFIGEIENFTARFLEEHPEANQYDDFNKWWQNAKK